MDDKLLLALISAGSALLGSLIPTVFGYLNNKKQQEFEERKALNEKQKQIYSELMLSLQKIMNTLKNDDFFELQRAVLQVSIYGDDSTASALNDYYVALIASAQSSSPLQGDQHKYHQKQILDGMRKSLGLKPLPSFEIFSFRPQPETNDT